VLSDLFLGQGRKRFHTRRKRFHIQLVPGTEVEVSGCARRFFKRSDLVITNFVGDDQLLGNWALSFEAGDAQVPASAPQRGRRRRSLWHPPRLAEEPILTAHHAMAQVVKTERHDL